MIEPGLNDSQARPRFAQLPVNRVDPSMHAGKLKQCD